MINSCDITIWSLGNIARTITEVPTVFNIVSIRSSNIPQKEYGAFEKYRRNYKDITIEFFDDIRIPVDGHITPSQESIGRILKWAEKRKHIAVHCTAGISRSSAIAYLIACQRTSPKHAVKILDPAKHSPNLLILNLGAEILGNKSVSTEYVKWFEKAFSRFS